jgi:hypothetical protein
VKKSILLTDNFQILITFWIFDEISTFYKIVGAFMEENERF